MGHSSLSPDARFARWARKVTPASVRRLVVGLYWRLRALVEDLQEYTGELVGYVPCHRLRLWWYRHACRARIGPGASIHRRCRVYAPHRITIGARSVVNCGVLLDGRRGLQIGDNVSISEGTVILTLGHDVDDPGFGLKGAPVTIGDRAFVGAYARILPGVAVGEGAVVGAAALVTRDVAPYTVVGGVPARYIRDRSRNLCYELSYRKRFG